MRTTFSKHGGAARAPSARGTQKSVRAAHARRVVAGHRGTQLLDTRREEVLRSPFAPDRRPRAARAPLASSPPREACALPRRVARAHAPPVPRLRAERGPRRDGRPRYDAPRERSRRNVPMTRARFSPCRFSIVRQVRVVRVPSLARRASPSAQSASRAPPSAPLPSLPPLTFPVPARRLRERLQQCRRPKSAFKPVPSSRTRATDA